MQLFFNTFLRLKKNLLTTHTHIERGRITILGSTYIVITVFVPPPVVVVVVTIYVLNIEE
jgi:hypothetical protein